MSLRSQVSWRSLSFERSQTKKRSNDQREVGHLTTVSAYHLSPPCKLNAYSIPALGTQALSVFRPDSTFVKG
uniref:Uncharacterized protein n=1 Tax=Coccidioides posadasii RMSCC 3488 TaxID=454284 RepID=A0A0J6FCK1_COCPO|nr:hypothetical protein CPAG_02962 [Coccidioides posadasii RMSCC 3488]